MNLMSDHLKGADNYWQDLIDRVGSPASIEPASAWVRLTAGP